MEHVLQKEVYIILAKLQDPHDQSFDTRPVARNMRPRDNP